MPPDSFRVWVAALIGAATLMGCSSSLGHLDRKTDSVTPADRAAASATAVAGYLEVLQKLVQGAPAQQAEILVAAQREYETAPTPSHQLRYALALAVPNHPGTDASRAQRLLQELLATPETLLPAERALAYLELQKMDQQLALASENQRLQSGAADRGDEQRLASVRRQLKAEQEENERLRKELRDVRAKLEQVIAIERSVDERKPGNEGRSP
jgi:hypothetical protein